MNAEDRDNWKRIECKIDELTTSVHSLTYHIHGNGSGKGIYDRLECLERWQAKFWAKVGGIVVGTMAVFKGIEALGEMAGWW